MILFVLYIHDDLLNNATGMIIRMNTYITRWDCQWWSQFLTYTSPVVKSRQWELNCKHFHFFFQGCNFGFHAFIFNKLCFEFFQGWTTSSLDFLRQLNSYTMKKNCYWLHFYQNKHTHSFSSYFIFWHAFVFFNKTANRTKMFSCYKFNYNENVFAYGQFWPWNLAA